MYFQCVYVRILHNVSHVNTPRNGNAGGVTEWHRSETEFGVSREVAEGDEMMKMIEKLDPKVRSRTLGLIQQIQQRYISENQRVTPSRVTRREFITSLAKRETSCPLFPVIIDSIMRSNAISWYFSRLGRFFGLSKLKPRRRNSRAHYQG